MENIKTTKFHLIQMMQPSNNSQICKLMDIFTTTMGWSIKNMSHMALEELSRQIIVASLMGNSKMERDMDLFDRYGKVVSVINKNIKMVRI